MNFVVLHKQIHVHVFLINSCNTRMQMMTEACKHSNLYHSEKYRLFSRNADEPALNFSRTAVASTGGRKRFTLECPGDGPGGREEADGSGAFGGAAESANAAASGRGCPAPPPAAGRAKAGFMPAWLRGGGKNPPGRMAPARPEGAAGAMLSTGQIGQSSVDYAAALTAHPNRDGI